MYCSIPAALHIHYRPADMLYGLPQAGLSVGYWKSTDDIRKNWSVDRTFDPEITQNERDSKVRMWKKAVSYSFNWDK